MKYHGFECEEFEFEGHSAKVIIPKKKDGKAALILKTEYFEAFPETEIKLVEKGNFLAFIKNDNRWGTDSDVDRKARFIGFVLDKYDIPCGCVPVGMSCGGIFAVKLAAKYPEIISCVYADAPVVNYMSCPCGFGIGHSLNDDNSEIMNALSFGSIAELLAYRDMPLDNLHRLIENRIPLVLVAGDSDDTVPYSENGAFIEKAYRGTGIDFEVYIKPGCNHHPHGLSDPTPVVDFIMRNRYERKI